MTIRVLIIDDSAIVRKLLTRVLSADPEIEVVGTAPDPFVGRDKIVRLAPDVLILDVEMPRMDGVTFLRTLMSYRPMPVLIVSSITTSRGGVALDALRAGAVDVVSKPGGAYTLGDIGPTLIQKVKAAKNARLTVKAQPKGRPKTPQLASMKATHRIAAIGASTGGTTALEAVLADLPSNTPGTVVVQHMPAEFTRSFAQRLNEISSMEVKEAAHGDLITPGRVLIAPGGRHMEIRRSGALFQASISDGPPVNRHRPSVDVLFNSVAQQVGKNAIGVILTGMGEDGAEGLLRLRESGAFTVAQNEETCVVFGMPKAAIDRGAADRILPLDRIAHVILEASRDESDKGHAGANCG